MVENSVTRDNVVVLPNEYKMFRAETGNRFLPAMHIRLSKDDEYGATDYFVWYSDLRTVKVNRSGEIVLRDSEYEFVIKGRHFDKAVQSRAPHVTSQDSSLMMSFLDAIKLQRLDWLQEWGREFEEVPESEPCIESIVVKKLN